jgi:hypothetical protein
MGCFDRFTNIPTSFPFVNYFVPISLGYAGTWVWGFLDGIGSIFLVFFPLFLGLLGFCRKNLLWEWVWSDLEINWRSQVDTG